MEPPADRIELESKIAFLERTVETLSEVVAEQADRIEDLERRLALQESRRASEIDAEPGPASLLEERPPHY